MRLAGVSPTSGAVPQASGEPGGEPAQTGAEEAFQGAPKSGRRVGADQPESVNE